MKNNIVRVIYITLLAIAILGVEKGYNVYAKEQINFKKRPFNCLKLTIKVRNPVFYGFHEKKLNKLMSINLITDRKKSEFFMQQMKQFQRQQRRMIE